MLEATIIVNDWYSLGLALGLEGFRLDKIMTETKGNVDDGQRAMVSLWLDTGNASWRALVQALKSVLVNKAGLAKDIAAKHL